ncbi:MAG: glycosyltransferase family 4 protein [Synechococcus sp. MIT S9220]|nr:glycosyltransferase family 4 protein [Synechococcus sp. MIT S9220]
MLGCLPLLRQRLLDQPSARSSHLQPTPSGGGVSFVALSCLTSCLCLMTGQFRLSFLPLLMLPLAIVGFLDDRYQLPATWRYGIQVFTAILIIWMSPLFRLSDLSAFWSMGVAVALLVLITAVINFTNFMDGLDGLVAGCMAVGFVVLSIKLDVPWSIWTLVGSLFGFLIWNWSPARVFMGDVGSTFLGAVFAGLVLHAISWPQALSYLLVVTPILADACSCVVRRFLAGQAVFKPHRLHLYQRLQQAGWTHGQVSITYITATALLAFAVLLGGLPAVILIAMAEIIAGFLLDRYVAIPFIIASEC